MAQAKPRSVTLVPICTVEGVTRYLELAAGNTPLEKQSSEHQDHCAFCSFETGRAVAISSSTAVLVVPQDAATLAE